MKQRIPNAIYSKEFREQAVKRVQEEGLSAEAVAKQLMMPKSTLAAWVTAAKEGKLGEVGKTQRPLTEMERELAKVKRELAEVKMERDLLKKRRRTLQRKSGEVRDDETITSGLSRAVNVPNL